MASYFKSRHESVKSFLSQWSNGNGLERQSHNQKVRGSIPAAAVSLRGGLDKNSTGEKKVSFVLKCSAAG